MRPVPIPGLVLQPRDWWLGLGMSTRRLAGPDLVTVFPGHLTGAARPATVNAMCHVLQTTVLPGCVLSHTTAAALLGIPLPWWVDRGIGVLSGASYRTSRGNLVVPSVLPARAGAPGPSSPGGGPSFPGKRSIAGSPPSSGEGPRDTPGPAPLTCPPLLHCRIATRSRSGAGPHVTVHRQAAAPTITWQGLTVSHPVVVLLELATMLEHDELVIAADALVGRAPPISGITLDGMRRAASEWAGRPGAAVLRRALGDVRANSGSPGETRTRLLLARAGFPEPALNHEVSDLSLESARFVDLAYPTLMIGVEYDGDYHRTRRDQWRDDQARADSLSSLGWRLRRLTADDIVRPTRFLDALRRTFLAAGATAPDPARWTGAAARTLSRPLRGPRDPRPRLW